MVVLFAEMSQFMKDLAAGSRYNISINPLNNFSTFIVSMAILFCVLAIVVGVCKK